ncbi:MAG: FtsX-like permease family protein [Candidatus Rokuibacteriota bacterium]|jgi:putative ABC transport system permease protein|nr:MAG: FtsX-like permease family protein [Candidatus Rokubacteria bacterium]
MIVQNARSAARALRVNKLRSVLTVLGVVVGVGAIIAMLAVGAGARASLAEQIQSLGSNQIVVLSGSTTASGVRLGQGSRVTLTEDDALALQREIPAVQAAAPTASRSMQVVHANLNWGVAVSGVTPEWFEVKEWDVVEGRAITAEDHRSAAKVVVVGQTAAYRLFADENPIGVTVRIGRVPFTVVGLLAPKGQSAWGHDQDDVMMVPLSTGRRQLFGRIRGMPRAVNVVVVKIRQGEDFAEAQAQMRELLRQRHRLQPERDDDFTLRDPYEVLQTQEEASRTMAYLLAAVGSVSLLVGGIGIMNVMLVSVTERTREIGLRMAVGARRRDILGQFLVEALTLALIGGAGGVAVGLAASHAIGYFAEWRTLIGVEAIALAFGFAPVVGVIFGLYPAHKAARLDPIDALRYE